MRFACYIFYASQQTFKEIFIALIAWVQPQIRKQCLVLRNELKAANHRNIFQPGSLFLNNFPHAHKITKGPDLEHIFTPDGRSHENFSIGVIVADVAKKLGADIKVKGFVRLAKGEGIEKKADDFAAEVASMVK